MFRKENLMDTETTTDESPIQAQPPTEGTCKKIFLAPGRAMVAVHNAMSSRHRKLVKGHWSYNAAAWTCAVILWFVVLAVVVGIPAVMIVGAMK